MARSRRPGGLRRSEITGLDCGPDETEDGAGWIEFLDQGLLIRVRGKTGWREVEIGRGSKRCGRRGPEGATAARLMEESTKAREPSPMPLRRSPGVVTITARASRSEVGSNTFRRGGDKGGA
jgi:hypothetical protein